VLLLILYYLWYFEAIKEINPGKSGPTLAKKICEYNLTKWVIKILATFDRIRESRNYLVNRE
jgi:hypothetical protein